MNEDKLFELLERIRYEPPRAKAAIQKILDAFSAQQERIYELERKVAYLDRPEPEPYSPMDIWV